MKTYLSGCGWGVLNAWNVWKSVLFFLTPYLSAKLAAFVQMVLLQVLLYVYSVALRPQRPQGLLGTGSPDDDDELMLNVLRCHLTY